MEYTIYVFACTHGKYYIATTNQSNNSWIKRHAPLSLIESIHTSDPSKETEVTKRYMKYYGIANVRGGAYATMDIPEDDLRRLTEELFTQNNTCSRCMRPGHIVANCHALTTVHGKLIDDGCSENSDDDCDDRYSNISSDSSECD